MTTDIYPKTRYCVSSGTMKMSHAPWSPVPDSSVLYMPGVPGSGDTITDISGNTNNGTITGATWENLGTGIWVLSFDGDDYVTVTDAASLSFGNATTDTAFSIKFWLYVTDMTSQSILAKGSSTQYEYALYTNADDKLLLELHTNGATGGVNLLYFVSDTALTAYQNSWTHIAVCYDGLEATSSCTMLVNGVALADTGTKGGSYVAMANKTANLRIGSSWSDGAVYITGKIGLPMITGVDYSSLALSDYQQERHLFGV